MPYRVKSVLNGAITLLSFVMTPVYCYYQEALFRGGTQNWIGAIFRSFLFGISGNNNNNNNNNNNKNKNNKQTNKQTNNKIQKYNRMNKK
jgi:hypothetical protein